MGQPFIINVNLSDVLCGYKETHYTMCIDEAKMTIVYELIEWIQWIFSLKHCIYLTHEGSVIHHFEDIRILSVLKNVKVHNCSQFNCVHMKPSNLFKKLNFFVDWNDIKVPKLFLNKVNVMSKKLVQKCLEDFNTCENQLSENLKRKTSYTKANYNRDSNIKMNNGADIMENSTTVHSVQPDKKEVVNDPTNISKSKESEVEEKKCLVDKNLSSKAQCKDKDNEIISPVKKKSQFKLDESKKLSGKEVAKPFSVGEILKTLRSELNTSSNDQEVKAFNTQQHQNYILSQVLSTAELECSKNNSTIDADLSSCQKKRKRIRKHKSKKQNSVDWEVESPSFSPKHKGNKPVTVGLHTACSGKKSSHIRFNSDDEDFLGIEQHQPNEQPKRTQGNFSHFNELVGDEMETCSSFINENQQTLPTAQLNLEYSENRDDDSPETNKQFSTLDKLILLHDQKSDVDILYEDSDKNNQHVLENLQLKSFDYDSSTLKALKEKFPSPMVVERFY